MYGMGKFVLATEHMDCFGNMYLPFVYQTTDNYGNGLWYIAQWPNWFHARYYFFCES